MLHSPPRIAVAFHTTQLGTLILNTETMKTTLPIPGGDTYPPHSDEEDTCSPQEE